MARAYIVLTRNDLEDVGLQILDLKPNASQHVPASAGPVQTHYKGYMGQGRDTALDDNGIPATADGDQYGLAPYLMLNINNNGNRLTDTIANDAADAIYDAASSGSSLTSADILTILIAEGANALVAIGTATVAQILRIMSGEVWKLPDLTAVAGGGNLFVNNASLGYFVTRPNVLKTFSHPGGRKFSERIGAGTATQDSTDDDAFRDLRVVYDSGDLHLSALSGSLFQLAQSDYEWENAAFSYGGAGDALTVGGSRIGTNHQARGVTVYDASGNVIV